jgi:hypothetical protein
MNDHHVWGAYLYFGLHGVAGGRGAFSALKLLGAWSASEALVNDLQRVADRQWRVDDEIDR